MNEFAKRLSEVRKKEGLTKKAFAEKNGWCAMYYARFENGQLYPGKKNYKAFSQLLNITVDELVQLINEERGEIK